MTLAGTAEDPGGDLAEDSKNSLANDPGGDADGDRSGFLPLGLIHVFVL